MSVAPLPPARPNHESSASTATAADPRLETDQARAALTTLQRSLRDSSGRIRTGLLRLRRGADHDSPLFEHQNSFHLKRPSRTQLQETAQALLRLFQSAGLPAEAQLQLERYLRDNGDRAQVSRIAELLEQHLPGTVAHPASTLGHFRETEP